MIGFKEGESKFIPLKSQTQQSQITKIKIYIDVIATSSGVFNHLLELSERSLFVLELENLGSSGTYFTCNPNLFSADRH